MIRKSIPLLALLVAVSALAQTRGHAVPTPGPITAATVTGVVTSVDGNNVSLANGLVVVDVSQATITDDRGQQTTITPGSTIFATLKSSTSLQAANVIVTKIPEITLSGTVQSVDTSANTFQLLGVTIHTDSNTSFGGSHNIRKLSDLVTGDLVALQANAVGQTLVASSILALTPPQQIQPAVLHGTVKSIGTDSWVITDSHGADVTVVVNAQTKILGSPKVGDTVDVLASVDSANNYVAIVIALSPVTNSRLHFTGVVKQIGSKSWVIGPAVGLGPDTIVQVNANTKIVGDPKVGDTVDVVLDPTSALNVALSITLVSTTPTQHITGVVKSIAIASLGPNGPLQLWTIAPDGGGPDVSVQVTSSTTFPGTKPMVGDHVDALVQKSNDSYIAISITKQ